MGLFSSQGKGNSNARTDASTQTTNTTVNQVDNRVYQSDFGAVTAGKDVSIAALELGRAALDTGTDNLNRGLDFAQDAYTSSLGFGRDVLADAVSSITDATTGALDTVTRSQDSTLGFLDQLVTSLFNFTGDTIDKLGNQASDLAAQSIAGNQSLAKATSESGDDKIVRIGGYAFGAIALIFVLPAIFGKK